jgi:predicted alpha/beta-fold hydrolase
MVVARENMSEEVENSITTLEPTEAQASSRFQIDEIAGILAEKPFTPHPFFVSGHAQTLGGYAWPRRFRTTEHRHDERRLFEIEPGVQLLGYCRWRDARLDHPTLIVVHGLEGSSDARYMLGTAAKALREGFNTIRLNLRNCGNTEHLTPTLYNSGMSGDLIAVVNELIERDGLRNIFLVGYSMSGNIVLKLAGENGQNIADKISGVCAVSPSVDLSACAAAIERRDNWLYQKSFMRSLHRRIKQKEKLFPDLYDVTDIRLIRTIREFDERYTAADGGYKDADDYYARASALPLIKDIRIPALIVHAQDDPFIPFDSLQHPSIAANPNVILLAPEHGGHLGFVGADTNGEDRFWSENRVVEFCRLIAERAPHSTFRATQP